MPLGFRTAVHRVVLRRGNELQVLRIVSLHSLHELHAHARGQIGILAVGLLAPPPARIAEDVYVRAPECQALVAPVLAAPLGFPVLRPGLVADRLRLGPQQLRVERGRQPDRLRKHRCRTRPGHSVQRLVPPFVGGHPEPGNRRRIVLQLRDLFLQCHVSYEVRGALLEAARHVPVRRLGRALRHRALRHRALRQRGARNSTQRTHRKSPSDPFSDAGRTIHRSQAP